jgi:hypothetical protein
VHGTNPQALASLDLSGHAAFGTKADLATVAGGGTAREEEVQQVRLPQPNLSASAAVEGAQRVSLSQANPTALPHLRWALARPAHGAVPAPVPVARVWPVWHQAEAAARNVAWQQQQQLNAAPQRQQQGTGNVGSMSN